MPFLENYVLISIHINIFFTDGNTLDNEAINLSPFIKPYLCSWSQPLINSFMFEISEYEKGIMVHDYPISFLA